MVARSGMTELILDVRGLCDAGTADYASGGVTFWTDDQLQDVLDKTRETIVKEPMQAVPEGTAYYDYRWKFADVERGNEFQVYDGAGSAVGTATYSVNYAGQTVSFATDQVGSAYFLTYKTYDLNAVAGEIWDKKAGAVAARFDVKTDNHDLKRSQLFAHYKMLAAEYKAKKRAKLVRMVRVDAC